MKIKNPLFLIDFYKADHRRQYPNNTVTVYSNFTPRSNKYAYEDSTEVVVFGIQYLIKEYLIDQWNEGFFNRPKEEVVEEYRLFMDRCLGPGTIPIDHIENLHDRGCLPIKIKALKEGTLCPIGVPVLTIRNTEPEFFWLTNYLETLLSNILWKPMTSATTAYMYRKEFERHSELTGSPKDFIGWQGHDFSFRGMSGVEDACLSGMGHLVSFNGTDTVPAIVAAMKYYPTEDFIGGSVPATEHSVMCMGGDGEGEFETFKRLITETYPSGIVSIVSDTWDFWKVMTDYLPRLKDEIEARDGRVVIRPDSGDPVDIVCGTANRYIDISKYFPEGEVLPEYFEEYLLDEVREDTPHGEYGVEEHTGLYKIRNKYYKATIHNISWNRHDKQYYYIDMWEKAKITVEEIILSSKEIGAYEILWDIFGGTTNNKGYKVLNPKVGLIYGDSINFGRQCDILRRLEAKGFAASNLVLGIGSFTYEFVTRDTYGFAMKATYGEKFIDGKVLVGQEIYKDPKTDSGLKKSAKGLLCVGIKEAGNLALLDQVTSEVENMGELETVFQDGVLMKEYSLTEVRETLQKQM
jgi:nicotinamide phosphoribosyltransferase